MAQWSDETEHPLSGINSGNQYEQGDHVSRQELNSIVENSAFAARLAKNAQSATDNGVSYNEQSATSAERQQVRQNTKTVGYESQTLTNSEKTQARQNIEAERTAPNEIKFGIGEPFDTSAHMSAYFGGTWTFLGQQNFLIGSTNVVGNGKALGLTDGSTTGGLYYNYDNTGITRAPFGAANLLGEDVGETTTGSGLNFTTRGAIGIVTEQQLGNTPENSGLQVMATTLTMYVWQRNPD